MDSNKITILYGNHNMQGKSEEKNLVRKDIRINKIRNWRNLAANRGLEEYSELGHI